MISNSSTNNLTDTLVHIRAPARIYNPRELE